MVQCSVSVHNHNERKLQKFCLKNYEAFLISDWMLWIFWQFWQNYRSVNFEMSFWCHCLDQKTNKYNVRISALKVFIASLGLPGSFFGVPVGFLMNDITCQVPRKPLKASMKPQKATKNFRAESLQYFCCYFGRNDDTQKTFRNQLTFTPVDIVEEILLML